MTLKNRLISLKALEQEKCKKCPKNKDFLKYLKVAERVVSLTAP
jgi:hypothetical protein